MGKCPYRKKIGCKFSRFVTNLARSLLGGGGSVKNIKDIAIYSINMNDQLGTWQ